MSLNEIKVQVVQMLQSVLSLDSSERVEAMGFLKECAMNFGLSIPENNGSELANKILQSTTTNLDLNPLSFEVCNKGIKDDSEGNDSSENKALDMNDELFSSNTVNSNSLSSEETSTEIVPKINEPTVECENKFEEKISKNKKTRKKQASSKSNKCNLGVKTAGKDKDKEFDDLSITESDSMKEKGRSRRSKKKIETKDENQENENIKEIFNCPGCMVTCESKSALLAHFTSHGKAPMSCRLCRSNFSSILYFWRHKTKQECKMSLFKCSECGEKFKYRRHYLKHLLGHNDNNCRYCDEKFSTWILYKHHLKKKHPEIKMERDLIPCKFCAMSFRRHLGLYNHYQIEHSKGKFVCLSCGLLLPTKEKFKEHSLVHESEKSWKCKICKMKFYRRQQLLFHISVHNSGAYKCLTCDITVTSKVDLYKHKKDGHEVKGLEPKFECEICHKNFKKRVVLKNHMATHSKEKKYYCKYCVKSFSTLDALQKHQKRKSHFEKAKIVLPESKYEKVYEDKLICESCGKQYKTQRELTWHLRVHKSTYECDECGKTFTLKLNLTKHIRKHTNKACFVCELCGNTFNQLSALNEHNLMKHSDIRNAECEVCKKKFKRKSELNRHMRIHETKRPFACFCGTAFKQSSHLQTHYKTFHEKNTEQTNNLVQAENFAGNETSEVFHEPLLDRRKPLYVNNEQSTLLSLGNMETETDYRNPGSYGNVQVTDNNEKGPYVSSYALRYSQNEMDPLNVGYDDLNFETSHPDKRELVFNSPAVDLSMVAISDVVQNNMALDGHRDITESVESFNKMPDDASNIQLVNLSEHIVQEYLLNLP